MAQRRSRPSYARAGARALMAQPVWPPGLVVLRCFREHENVAGVVLTLGASIRQYHHAHAAHATDQIAVALGAGLFPEFARGQQISRPSADRQAPARR